MSGVSHWFCASPVSEQWEIGVDWLISTHSCHWRHIWLPNGAAWTGTSPYGMTVWAWVCDACGFFFNVYVYVAAFVFIQKCASVGFNPIYVNASESMCVSCEDLECLCECVYLSYMAVHLVSTSGCAVCLQMMSPLTCAVCVCLNVYIYMWLCVICAPVCLCFCLILMGRCYDTFLVLVENCVSGRNLLVVSSCKTSLISYSTLVMCCMLTRWWPHHPNTVIL